MDYQRFQNLQACRVQAYTRTFDHADAEIAVEDTSAEIELGNPLPKGAIVLGVIVNVTQNWSDGSTGTFAADIGDGTDDDKFTPTALNIDGGVALLTQPVFVPGGEDQLVLTISGDVDLDTLTTGTMELTVLFVAPDEKAA